MSHHSGCAIVCRVQPAALEVRSAVPLSGPAKCVAALGAHVCRPHAWSWSGKNHGLLHPINARACQRKPLTVAQDSILSVCHLSLPDGTTKAGDTLFAYMCDLVLDVRRLHNVRGLIKLGVLTLETVVLPQLSCMPADK